MRVIESSSRETRIDTLTVADGEVRPVPFSTADKQYRIDTVTVERRRADGEPWILGTVTTSGPVVKMNGSDSRNRASERHWGHTYPDSLAAIVEESGADA